MRISIPDETYWALEAERISRKTTLKKLVIERLSISKPLTFFEAAKIAAAREPEKFSMGALVTKHKAEKRGSTGAPEPQDSGKQDDLTAQVVAGMYGAAPPNQRQLDLLRRVNCDSRDCVECRRPQREFHRAACGLGDRLAERAKEELK